MKSLVQHMNEHFESVNESKMHPQKIEIIKSLYLVPGSEKHDEEHGSGYEWTTEKSTKNNGFLKAGEVYVFSHEYKPKHDLPVGLNYVDEKGKNGPEFLEDELKSFISKNVIKEI